MPYVFVFLLALFTSSPLLASSEAENALSVLSRSIPKAAPSTGGPLVRVNASYFAPQTFASHSGDTLRVSTGGPSAGFQIGGRGDWADDLGYELAYGLRFPETAVITLGNGREERVGLLIHTLDWGLGYRVASPAGVDVGFKVFVGAEWPVDLGGYVFTGQDAFFAPQLWARLPSSGPWSWSLSVGVHMSKDFAPNNPGSAPAQPANAQGPLPQGSVSGGDALAFVRLDLEYLWPSK